MNISIEFIISLGLNLVLFVIIICLIISVAKIKKRISKFLPIDKEMNVEQMLCQYIEEVINVLEKEDEIIEKINLTREELNINLNEIKNQLQNNINLVDNRISQEKNQLQNSINLTNNRIDETKNQLRFAIQKVGFIRYNPFAEVGGDLCYAIAFLDENNNGVVINSIYARENCYSYAKNITNGESLNHKLSDEEIQALKMAMEK